MSAPYSASTREVALAAGRKPDFDWRTDGVADLSIGPPIASGLEPMLRVVRAIDDGRLLGRQLDWGSWIAVVPAGRLLAVLDDLHLAHPAGELPAGPCFIVAVET